MNRIGLDSMTAEEPVAAFKENGVAQDKAELLGEYRKFNRLYDKNVAILDELKGRPGDQRMNLLSLYDHPNMQVRLNAVRATLAVAPTLARQTLEAIANSRFYPQAGYAGMTISSLDNGTFKPT